MNSWFQAGRGEGKVLISTYLINLVWQNIMRNKATVSASEFELENNQVKKFPECVYS